MDFGRLEDLSGIDFALPEDDAATARVLAAAGPAANAPEIRLGLPVWRHDGFVGKIYPAGTPPAERLARYADQFPAIELNSTFYGVSREQTERWAAVVPEGFRFCPKVPRSISHDLGLRGAEEETRSFLDAVGGFGARLGPIWLQLPPGFGAADLDALAAWLALVPEELGLGVELRHPELLAAGAARERVFGLLEDRGAAAILSDVAGRRDALHMRLTAPELFLRFAGHRLHPSDFRRLDDWAERLALWAEAGLRRAWIFLHQPVEHETVELAEHLAAALTKRLGTRVPAPRRVVHEVQGGLFDEEDDA